MNGVLLILAWLAPLIAAIPALAGRGRWWLPIATLPALAASMLVPGGTSIDVSWLLLGVRFGLDAIAPVFLGFSAVLWLAAGLYAAVTMRKDPHAGRFRFYFLLAMSGNFALIIGLDLVSFYFGFALMGLAAYGLVVHEGNDRVRQAGRVYLAMTLVGEVALFGAFLLIFSRTGTLIPTAELIVGGGPVELGLLMLAFGIKAGMLGLHVWLPLAHPAAPVPASAVLSGAMIKAALIGWMRYLPLGQVALPELGALLLYLGAAGALVAMPLALVQRDPKVVLAYSSIAKMGAMIAALGMALLEPGLAPALVLVLTFYAAHHGLAKGALFLGVGVVKFGSSRWPMVLLLLLALVMVGAPFTSGALAKDRLSQVLLESTSHGTVLLWILSAAALGTALVMGRFLYLVHAAVRTGGAGQTLAALPWLGLAAVSLGLPLIYGGVDYKPSGVWPVLAAAILGFAVIRWNPHWLSRWVGLVPAGDVLQPLLRSLRHLKAAFRQTGEAYLAFVRDRMRGMRQRFIRSSVYRVMTTAAQRN